MMQLLAGIHIAWAIVYLVIGLSILPAFLRSGRDRMYLTYSFLCAQLMIFSLARSSFYMGGGSLGNEMAGRIVMALFPTAAATMLSMAARRAGLRSRRHAIAMGVLGGISIFFMGASMAGWVLDESHVVAHSIFPSGQEELLKEYSLAPLGYLLTVHSLALALATCVLLVKGAMDDRFIGMYFIASFAALVVFTVNDVLLQARVIRSFYMVEHGILLINVGVLASLLREFERSRAQLQHRTRELEQANERLEALATDLDDSFTRLDRITDETRMLRPMADLGRLSASLAHEIRNPLAVLANVAATLKRHRTGGRNREEYDELVEMMKEETNRLARLVDDLLLFSQTGRLSREPVDVKELIDLAVGDVESAHARADGVEIDVDVMGGVPLFPGSVDSLRRALVNLIVNALQSTRGAGRIRVMAKVGSSRPDSVLIGVQDEGGGIPQEDIAMIFEPFFSTRPTGTGLGLPIVKSIVEAHDGDIVLENRPGEGVTFWLSLPILVTRPSMEP